MADQTKTKIILRNGTAAQWVAKNPVLLAGEAGIETDTRRVKYGNGVTAWNDLEYAAGSKPVTATAWGEVTGTLSNQTDLKTVLDSKESTAQKGVAGGYAPLNEEGKVPMNHIPPIESFVKGMILMWSGALAEIPAGWALCDGQSGRPNLLGKFIRGIGTAGTQPGGTGGADSIALNTNHLPVHAHSIASHSHTVSLGTTTGGAHNHHMGYDADNYLNKLPTMRIGYGMWLGVNRGSTPYNVTVWAFPGIGMTSDMYRGETSITGDAAAHSHTVSGSTAGVALTTGNAGSGTAFDNRPAYYELAFIIKL